MTVLNNAPASLGQKTAASLNWFKNTAGREWNLSTEEMCVLLGGVARRTLQSYFQRAEAGEELTVSRDMYDRLSILLGIYAALAMFGPEGAAQSFFTRPYNAEPLNGKSVKDELLSDGGLVRLNNMRRWLNAKRG